MTSLRPYLGGNENVNPVEKDAVHATPKVLLIAQEDLIEVSHAAHEDAEVDVQLVESSGQMDSENRINLIKNLKKINS